jgi:hypothetical protein
MGVPEVAGLLSDLTAHLGRAAKSRDGDEHHAADCHDNFVTHASISIFRQRQPRSCPAPATNVKRRQERTGGCLCCWRVVTDTVCQVNTTNGVGGYRLVANSRRSFDDRV